MMTGQTDKLKQLNGELCAEVNAKDARIREMEALVRDMAPFVCADDGIEGIEARMVAMGLGGGDAR